MRSQERLAPFSEGGQEGGQTPAQGETPPPPAPNRTERQRRSLQIILGVALPLIAGSMVWWVPPLWNVPDVFDAAGPFYIVAAATVLFAFLGGALLRSWWALLIAPAAWLVGEMLASAIAIPIIAGYQPPTGGSGMPLWQIFLLTAAVLAPLGSAPNVVFAGLGVLFSRWWQRREPGSTVSAPA